MVRCFGETCKPVMRFHQWLRFCEVEARYGPAAMLMVMNRPVRLTDVVMEYYVPVEIF